jgi:hypothetical protein
MHAIDPDLPLPAWLIGPVQTNSIVDREIGVQSSEAVRSFQ